MADLIERKARLPRPEDATLERIADAVGGFYFRASSERELHDGISAALDAAKIEHEREVVIEGGRLDFLCGSVAIEVKVDGSLADLTHQVYRYLEDDRVGAVLVVTTRSQHLRLTGTISGKHVGVLRVSRR